MKWDSVTNGISDSEVDIDGDDVISIDELLLDTDPLCIDTDDDGLLDGSEINETATNPINADTDNDGLLDGDETILNLNPLDSDSDNDGILDGDEYTSQVINIEQFETSLFTDNLAIPSYLAVYTKGNANRKTCISEYNGYLKGEEREYVGKAIQISDSDISGGKLSFNIDKKLEITEYIVDDITKSNLIICYNDGENTIPLETEYNKDARTLTANISGEGIYFVLDVVAWLSSFDINFSTQDDASLVLFNGESNLNIVGQAINNNIPISGQVDIVFIIDTTGSMGSSINNVKNNIISFADEINGAGIKASYALVEYKDITCSGELTVVRKRTNTSNWFYNVSEFKEKIDNLEVLGGGDAPETAIDALEVARQLDMRTSSQKFFILITDANYKTYNDYGISSMDEMIQRLVDNNIHVSVVSSHSYKSSYQSLYEKTDGIFGNINGDFKNELLSIAGIISEQANDGYWIAINGLLPIFTKLDAKPQIGSVVNSDDDSLSDIEELKSLKPTKYININSYVHCILGEALGLEQYSIPVYECYSYPNITDSDGDGIDDYKLNYIYGENETIIDKDNRPLEKGYYSSKANDVVIGEMSIVSCDNGLLGHAFLVYQSHIDDTLDFTRLTAGYDYMTWESSSSREYPIKSMEYVSIGNAGQGVGGSSQPSEGSITGVDGDIAGIYFNREFAMEKNNYDKNYSGSNNEFKQKYDQNKAYSLLITESQLNDIISTCNKKNYYNLVTNNCAKLAVKAWNSAFDIKLKEKLTPSSLKKQIGELDGSYTFDMYEVLGVEL